MKKIYLLITFLFCAIFSFAQYVTVPQGLPNQNLQAQGMSSAKLGFSLPVLDTLNNKAIGYYGALTVRPQDTVGGNRTPPIYMSNGHFWYKITSSGADSLAYRSITSTADSTGAVFHSLIGIPDTVLVAGSPQVNSDWNATNGVAQILNKPVIGGAPVTSGIITPGAVTWSGHGLVFDVASSNYFINSQQYISPSTQITLVPADSTKQRIDAFYVDTIPSAGKITGTAAVAPISPQVNPQSQLLLTTVLLNPLDTIPSNIKIETIYDENTGSPEWTPTSSGTGTVNFANTVNPYHLTHSIVQSGVSAGFTMIFTKPSGIDTAHIGDVLKLFFYTANVLPSGYIFQFFSGTTPVSTPLTINSPGYGFNPNTYLGTYQNVSIPFAAFTFLAPQYNSLQITAIGANANPVYFDYIQIQTGLYQFAPTDYSNKVDSVTANSNNLYYWVKGSQHFVTTLNVATTNKITIVATGGQTMFTFSGLPTNVNNYDIYVNGSYINPTFYSISGTTITFSTGLVTGDIVDYAEKK